MASPTLTQEELFRINEYLKCKKDPAYFIENYAELPTVGGNEKIKLYTPQKDFLMSLIKDHHIIALKSRQIGISTLTQLFVLYTFIFFKNVVVGCVSRDGPESTDFCRKVMSLIKTVPEWMRPKFVKETEQTFILDTGCQFYASQVNEGKPGGLFRGKALTILIIDEASHISRIDDAYTGCAPALAKSQKSARINGVPYATIIISTPNKTVGVGRWYYEQWKYALSGESIFKPKKIHWSDVEEFKNDPGWYKIQCQILGNIRWKIDQEMEMQFIASENSFFPGDTVKQLNESIIKPLSKISVGKWELWQFERVDPNKFVLIGIDTAPQFGSDKSSIQIVDFETFNQIAEFKSKLRVDDFCEVIYLVNKLYPNNLIIVEANSYGNQVVETLTKSSTFYNMYKQKTINKESEKKASRYRYGLYTGPQTRPLMIDALYTYITEDPGIIKSERTILELIGLAKNSSGKIEAESGEHDDLAMALAFCAYVKLYDPPLGMGKTLLNKETSEEFQNITSWNDEQTISPDLIDLHNIDDNEDYVDRVERSNKLINNHIHKNFDKILQNGNVIDITKLFEWNKDRDKK